MVRQDTVCAMRSDASLRSRSRSAGGTFSITSTSPASSAAVRAGSLGIARKLTLSTADHRLARIEVSGRRFERDVLRYDHDRIEILRQRAVWRRCLQAYG